MINLPLTEQDAIALQQLLNVACRAGGLENNVAQAAVYFDRLIRTAAAEAAAKTETEAKAAASPPAGSA